MKDAHGVLYRDFSMVPTKVLIRKIHVLWALTGAHLIITAASSFGRPRAGESKGSRWPKRPRLSAAELLIFNL